MQTGVSLNLGMKEAIAESEGSMFDTSNWKLRKFAVPVLAATALALAGCTSSMNSTTTASSTSGAAFIVGTDAPVASVTSFTATITSMTATDTSGNTVSLVSGSPAVDFARYNGLQTLLDINDVPQGTYTSVTIGLAAGPTIGYLDTTGATPAIKTMTGSLNSTSIKIPLNKNLVIAHASAPVGLRVDFDLKQSLVVDSNGNFTGAVNPTFDVNVVGVGDGGAYIDEFVAGVTSVNASGQSFVVNGPHGETFNINVNGQTEWDGNATLQTLAAGDIVELSGKLDAADQTLDADEVAILSTSNFFASGQITYVTAGTSGAASNFDLYVRGLEPQNNGANGVTLGQIAQVNLSGNEKYFIYWMHNPFTNFLFNANALVAGQAVTVGGPVSGAANANAVTVDRIHLRNWGFNGTVVAGSQNSSNGTFQMQVNGFAGVLLSQPITVYLGNDSDFRYGLGKFGDVTNGDSIRVVGLLLKNPTNGQVVLLARHVDGFNLTDFSTFAY